MGRRPVRRGPYGVGGEDEDGLPAPITIRQARHDTIRRRLEGDPRTRAAAAVAHTFGLDPVTVASERDTLRRLFRLACHNVTVAELNRRAGG